MGRHANIFGLVAINGFLLIFPLMVKSPFYQDIFVMSFLIGYLGLCWNITAMTGLFSLGHAAFVGIGGFTSSILFNQFNITPWVGMFCGSAIAAAIACLISLPSLRLRGIYFCLSTIACANALLAAILVTLKIGPIIIGGTGGIIIRILGDNLLYFQSRNKIFFYYVTYFLMLIGIAIYSKIRRSKLGFYLRAIGNEAEAAQSLGINLSKYKLISFMISGALSAIAGTVLAQYTGFAEPNRLFGWEISFGIVVAVILGGGRYVPGPIIGGFAVTFISEMTRKYGGGSAVQGLNMIVYGFVLILVVHFMGRGGICSLLERGRYKWKSSKSGVLPKGLGASQP